VGFEGTAAWCIFVFVASSFVVFGQEREEIEIEEALLNYLQHSLCDMIFKS
jgi:hypothetical protein